MLGSSGDLAMTSRLRPQPQAGPCPLPPRPVPLPSHSRAPLLGPVTLTTQLRPDCSPRQKEGGAPGPPQVGSEARLPVGGGLCGPSGWPVEAVSSRPWAGRLPQLTPPRQPRLGRRTTRPSPRGLPGPPSVPSQPNPEHTQAPPWWGPPAPGSAGWTAGPAGGPARRREGGDGAGRGGAGDLTPTSPALRGWGAGTGQSCHPISTHWAALTSPGPRCLRFPHQKALTVRASD